MLCCISSRIVQTNVLEVSLPPGVTTNPFGAPGYLTLVGDPHVMLDMLTEARQAAEDAVKGRL